MGQSLTQTQIMRLAQSVIVEHGNGAASFVCDRVIESMGGDPVIEDNWHTVLELVCQLEPPRKADRGPGRLPATHH